MDIYGYNALSGFFGSSSRKKRKQDEIAYLEKIYNLQQQQFQQEEAARLQNQQAIDQSYQLATELTTGKNARKKDQDLIRSMSEDLLAPINEKIRMAGGYMKAKRLGIDQDLRDYQYALLNNDKVHSMKITQESIAKIIQSSQNEETKHLVPMAIREQFAQWQNEQIDSFNWDGIVDSPIDMSFVEGMTVEQAIGAHHVVAANPQILTDYYRHLQYQGDPNAEENYAYAIQNNDILISSGYLGKRLGQEELELPAFGTKKIETSLGKEILEIRQKMFPNEGTAGGDIINSGGMVNYVKNSGWADRIESTIGLDQKNPNLMSKDGFILASGGAIGTVGQVDHKILLANYGLMSDGGRLYQKDGEWYLKSQEGGAEGLYNAKGSFIEDASWMDATTHDMKIRGIYLGAKCSYYNQDTQQVESFLLTEAVADLDPATRAKTMNEKIKSNYSDVKFTPAYVVQLEEWDFFNNDAYYDEVIIQDAELAKLNDDEKLNQAMEDGRNIRATLNNEQIQEERRAEMEIATLTSLDKIYAGGNPGGFNTIAKTYEIPFRSVVSTSGMSNRMLPYVMADFMEQASITAQQTGRNPSEILTQSLNEFSNLAKEDPTYYKLLMSGDEKSLREYQKQNYGKRWNVMKKRYTLWNRYFNR